VKSKEIYINREVSWLQFNERVIEEAEDETTPLLERLRFLGIALSNSDEFYRVRVGMLFDQMLVDDEERDDKAGKTIATQLKDTLRATRKLLPRFNGTYAQIMEAMRDFGVQQIRWDDPMEEIDRVTLEDAFKHQVAPRLAPFVIEKNSPLPFFENGEIIVGAALRTRKGNERIGLISLPDDIDRVIYLPAETCRFILVEDMIRMFAEKVFHKFTVQEKTVFSIIRNADIDGDEGIYDFDISLKDTMAKILKRRDGLAPIKIKYDGCDCPELFSYLSRRLLIKKSQTFAYDTPLDFRFLTQLEHDLPADLKRALCFLPHVPAKNPSLDENSDMIGQVLKNDILLTYPFEDFSAVITLLRQAAADDQVRSLHITFYRAAWHSEIMLALIEAAKAGKEVTCVIELRARFDEGKNIDWASQLRDAGCQVLYGVPGHKIHSKLLLIERTDDKKICLVSTGNFNELTALVYTDISLITADKNIVNEVQKVFEAIRAKTFVEYTEHLLVAPLGMKNRLIEMIEGEIEKQRRGEPTEIILKLNSLTEKEMIDKLIEASQAGVKVKLIIRGICCVVPGVKGETDNISVRSIIGRYLEHSRIYVFGVGQARKYYISSADLMTRNLTRRVEVAAPVYDRACQEKLQHILDLELSDNSKARILKPTGKYVRAPRRQEDKLRDSQQELSDLPR